MHFFAHITIEIEEDCCFFFLGSLLERFEEHTSKLSLHLYPQDYPLALNGSPMTQMALNLTVKSLRHQKLMREIYIDSEELNDSFMGPTTND